MKRGATLFSCAGGVEALLKDHIDFVHAVEYDPAIAEVYRANHGDHITVGDVRGVDYTTWGALDYLHASPVCKNFSAAKTGGVETDEDMQTAQAVVRCLEATQPRVFTLENVRQYEGSASYRTIVQWLNNNGYMWHAEVLNSADFLVPQTRRRLILRAVKDALLPTLPPKTRWVGWYEAIEDLIPTLPESRFADWQIKRLDRMDTSFAVSNDRSDDYKGGTYGATLCYASDPMMTIKTTYSPRAFIVSNAKTEYSDGIRDSAEPMLSVTRQSGGRVRAFLVGEDSKMGMVDAHAPAMTMVSSPWAVNTRGWLIHANDQRSMPTRRDDDPAFTIGAGSHNTHAPDTKPKTWLHSGRVVKMTPRALARFQSFPDSFVLPSKSSLACCVVGNAVPPLMMRAIVRGLV